MRKIMKRTLLVLCSVLVFDGLRTYLFHSQEIPDGFTRDERYPGVCVFEGQHPLARRRA